MLIEKKGKDIEIKGENKEDYMKLRGFMDAIFENNKHRSEKD